MSYCQFIRTLAPGEQDLHRRYHDEAYGFPINNDDELFGRLILEINQAGLSWTTILKKEAHFRRAYHGFQVARVAAYGEEDKERLLQDAGIIRNRLKIEAAVHNARVVMQLQQEYGSFRQWLDAHHPLPKEAWVKLFRKQFRFTGGEIVNEFLLSTGYLPGAHQPDCPVYTHVLRAGPAWCRG
jgi:DNA-3-methyladenine glycosylase I